MQNPCYVPKYQFVSRDKIKPQLSGRAVLRLQKILPGWTGAYVAIFPYFAGNAAGNLSLYARGADYHTVVARYLKSKIRRLREKHNAAHFIPLTDASPLPEIQLAAIAGLGTIGKNGLLLTKQYGSYVFIGTILTDAPNIESSHTMQSGSSLCTHCGRCIKACPTGSILNKEETCLSHSTQKKGSLTEQESALIAKTGTIWGCDLCQLACPCNKHTKITPIRDFKTNLIPSLTTKALTDMSERAFTARAFSFRTKEPLLRNLRITKE